MLFRSSIKIGSDADLAIINPNTSYVIDREKSFSKSKNIKFPYQGRKVNCKIETTLVRGKVVFDNDNIIIENGYGRMVRPLI